MNSNYIQSKQYKQKNQKNKKDLKEQTCMKMGLREEVLGVHQLFHVKIALRRNFANSQRHEDTDR